ncbi:Dabb family protein [Yoonia sp. GPGPB17]|uniref:Dabb family protein n=1 Tax=Yoonia sp. GPGPB17 TaxID=3026147 RepID=UPI0030BB2FA8
MIKHIVLLDLDPDYNPAELTAIMEGLDDLRHRLDGFQVLEHGPNKDFEGMSTDCTYAFICHFADEDTSRRYILNPEHNELGQRLVRICRGGVNGISVIDMAVTS